MIEEFIEMSKQGVSRLGEANSALNGHAIVKDQLFYPSTRAPHLGCNGCLHSNTVVSLGNLWSCSVGNPLSLYFLIFLFEKCSESPVLTDSSKEHNLLFLIVVSQCLLFDLLVWVTSVLFVIKVKT